MPKASLVASAGALAFAVFATSATGPEAMAADKFSWANTQGSKPAFDRLHLVQFFDLFYGDLNTDAKKSGKSQLKANRALKANRPPKNRSFRSR
jgi:hypothetical protein